MINILSFSMKHMMEHLNFITNGLKKKNGITIVVPKQIGKKFSL